MTQGDVKYDQTMGLQMSILVSVFALLIGIHAERLHNHHHDAWAVGAFLAAVFVIGECI